MPAGCPPSTWCRRRSICAPRCGGVPTQDPLWSCWTICPNSPKVIAVSLRSPAPAQRGADEGEAMAQVNTVRGPVDGGRLGRTLMHEHIFVLSPEIEKTAAEWDELAEQARAVTKLRELKAHGDRHARRPHRHRTRALHPAGGSDRRAKYRRSTSWWRPACTRTTKSRCTSISGDREPFWGGPNRWWTSSCGRSARASGTPACGPASSSAPLTVRGSLRAWSV